MFPQPSRFNIKFSPEVIWIIHDNICTRLFHHICVPPMMCTIPYCGLGVSGKKKRGGGKRGGGGGGGGWCHLQAAMRLFASDKPPAYFWFKSGCLETKNTYSTLLAHYTNPRADGRLCNPLATSLYLQIHQTNKQWSLSHVLFHGLTPNHSYVNSICEAQAQIYYVAEDTKWDFDLVRLPQILCHFSLSFGTQVVKGPPLHSLTATRPWYILVAAGSKNNCQ